MDLIQKTVNSSQVELEIDRTIVQQSRPQRIPIKEIRRSLKASTIDGVFAAVFSNLTGGVLLSNFLVNLQASSWEIGILSAIPMLANFVQPWGAWLGDRVGSRLRYCSSIFFPARFVWVFLLLGIVLYRQQVIDDRAMAIWTMAVVAVSHLLGGMGSATWLSWIATLVPRQLRGRYFSTRNSAANLTSFVVVAIAGTGVANYPRGEVEGFAIALGVGIIAGLISLVCQWQMVDLYPQDQIQPGTSSGQDDANSLDLATVAAAAVQPESALAMIARDRHFQGFLLYFSAWMFSVNFSAPFFNLYLLQDLSIDLSWVTLYNSLASAANLALLMPFGRWSDSRSQRLGQRIGNRLPLLGMGLVMVVLPLLWLGVGTDSLSRWLGLPLLYILNGSASAAIDLCSNNLQIEISLNRHQAKYFGITAAITGVSGALGTVLGGGLARLDVVGGLTGLFAISSILRLLSLLPLVWLRPEGGRSLLQLFELHWLGRSIEGSN